MTEALEGRDAQPDPRKDTLPVYPNSYTRRHGGCGALLADDVECYLPAGHLIGDVPHRSRSPYGDSAWIEYDDRGNVLTHSSQEAR